MGQQNSPVPSPYTPQSPATGYIQPFPHQQPPSYNQHQQIQQGKSLIGAPVWRDNKQFLSQINNRKTRFIGDSRLVHKISCISNLIQIWFAHMSRTPFKKKRKQNLLSDKNHWLCTLAPSGIWFLFSPGSFCDKSHGSRWHTKHPRGETIKSVGRCLQPPLRQTWHWGLPKHCSQAE